MKKKKNRILIDNTKMSDEELALYKDFGSVLKASKGMGTLPYRYSLYKGAIVLSGVSVLLIYVYSTFHPTTVPTRVVQDTISIALPPITLREKENTAKETPAPHKPDHNTEETPSVIAMTPVSVDSSATSSTHALPYAEPKPVEGYPALYAFLQKELRYPAAAALDSIEGKVIVDFTISAKGEIENASVAQGIGHGLDEEAVRVVNSMPKWHPAILNGKPVKSKASIPVVFDLGKK